MPPAGTPGGTTPLNENTTGPDGRQTPPVPVFQSAPGADQPEQPEVTHAVKAMQTPAFTSASQA